MAAQVPSGILTPLEQSLVEHVCRGEWLDLAVDDEVVDETAMRSWGDDRTCRATVIRDILRGRLAPNPDPHGLRLRGARIAGRLDLENLTTDVSLGLTDCLLEEGLLARGARLAFVNLTGCLLEHPDDPPLDAARLTCSGLDLGKTTITGHADTGAVDLTGARTGTLKCSGASMRNDSGPALMAEDLQADQGIFLTSGFTATGVGWPAAVSLVHVRTGVLNCNTASLRNDSGAGLAADFLQANRVVWLTGFTATCASRLGAVFLFGARTGTLSCVGASLCNDSGPALAAQNLQVDQDMLLTGGFSASGDGVAVDLTGVRVGGTLVFPADQLTHAADSRSRLAVDGLTYAGVPDQIPVEGWLDLLRDCTPHYAAQPYQQLAAGYRALGDERVVREILMAQRDDQLARTDPRPRWPERLWGRVTKVTLGYGYQPWRALLFLAAVVVMSCVLAVVLGAHGALVQTSKMAIPGRSCTVVQQVSVGLDLNLPVGTTVARADCDLTMNSASVTSAWLSAVGWVLRLAAWVFAALFIAGFTSAVRKT